MPRHRRKAKGASSVGAQQAPAAAASSVDSTVQSSENVVVVKQLRQNDNVSTKKQTRNRGIVEQQQRPLSDSSASSTSTPLFNNLANGNSGGGDSRPPAKREKSSLSTGDLGQQSTAAAATTKKSFSSSFWSSGPVGILKTPARKISDVGAAIKRKLKQNFAVSFLLDPSPQRNREDDDEDESSCGGKIRNHRSTGKTTMASSNDNSSSSSSSPNDYYLPPSGPAIRPVPSANTLNRLERTDIVVWRHPIQTITFFFLELGWLLYENTLKLWTHRKHVLLAVIFSIVGYFAYNIPGPHQTALRYFEKKMFWCAYWIGLGVLSSVGLGTGLHTFLLYLGPHIASVTLAAYECHSLKFPEPPYPDQIVCPSVSATSTNSSHHQQQQAQAHETHSGGLDDGSSTLSSLVATTAVISLWQIMYKVALESFMWGAGTALGELPPYFMARAARLSGQEPEDEDYQEYIQYVRATRPAEEEGVFSRGKIYVEKLVEYAGFWGILMCASIPNPFFDLAGITCGHFLVPFATFFAATLIGKAVIKMTIQQVFIILAFSEHHMEAMVGRLKYIPVIGPSLQAPFKEYLKQQKTKLHRKPGDPVSNKNSLLGKFFEMIVFVMIAFFLVSLVNSLAQNYHRRRWQARKRELEAKLH